MIVSSFISCHNPSDVCEASAGWITEYSCCWEKIVLQMIDYEIQISANPQSKTPIHFLPKFDANRK